MRRWSLIVAGVLVFAFVAAQVLIPSLGERRVESRLTEGGGSAEVTLGAFPAARLLFSDGERFEVEASDLQLDVDEPVGVFDRLDGFAIVDVSIADSTAGPFELESFTLTRDGDGPYRLVSQGTASPVALADYGLERYQLPGDGLIGAARSVSRRRRRTLPVDLDMEVLRRRPHSRRLRRRHGRRPLYRAARRPGHLGDRGRL